jgi:plastocyanin
MKKIWIAVAVICTLTLVSCGGDKPPETAKTEGSAPAAAGGGAAAAPDEANGGTVTGKVAFAGDKPKMKELDMSANPVCERAHKGSAQKSEEVIVNDNGTLKYVFVWVKSGLPDKNWAVPTTPITLDQNGCMYKPHVIGIVAGQNIEVKNSDPTNHNIHPQPSVNQEWNESQTPGSESKMKTFARQEVMIPVKCNVHPWMRSYIGVVSHPFFFVTSDDGTFTIKGLPPGTYTIEAWHEKYGKQEQQVTVAPKESKTLDFSFKG